METQKIYTVTQWEYVGFFVQFKPKFAYKPFDFGAAVLQIRLVIAYQKEIVHIPPVKANMEFFLDKVV